MSDPFKHVWPRSFDWFRSLIYLFSPPPPNRNIYKFKSPTLIILHTDTRVTFTFNRLLCYHFNWCVLLTWVCNRPDKTGKIKCLNTTTKRTDLPMTQEKREVQSRAYNFDIDIFLFALSGGVACKWRSLHHSDLITRCLHNDVTHCARWSVAEAKGTSSFYAAQKHATHLPVCNKNNLELFINPNFNRFTSTDPSENNRTQTKHATFNKNLDSFLQIAFEIDPLANPEFPHFLFDEIRQANGFPCWKK